MLSNLGGYMRGYMLAVGLQRKTGDSKGIRWKLNREEREWEWDREGDQHPH